MTIDQEDEINLAVLVATMVTMLVLMLVQAFLWWW